jgi:hypothetical protein
MWVAQGRDHRRDHLTTGLIPQSTALSEASPESLSEALSADPELYSANEASGEKYLRLQRVVAALRAMRERNMQAEREKGESKRSKKALTSPQELLSSTPVSAEELGF